MDRLYSALDIFSCDKANPEGEKNYEKIFKKKNARVIRFNHFFLLVFYPFSRNRASESLGVAASALGSGRRSVATRLVSVVDGWRISPRRSSRSRCRGRECTPTLTCTGPGITGTTRRSPFNGGRPLESLSPRSAFLACLSSFVWSVAARRGRVSVAMPCGFRLKFLFFEMGSASFSVWVCVRVGCCVSVCFASPLLWSGVC